MTHTPYASYVLPLLWLVPSLFTTLSLYKLETRQGPDRFLLRGAFAFSIPTLLFTLLWLFLGIASVNPHGLDYAALAGIGIVHFLRAWVAPWRGEPRFVAGPNFPLGGWVKRPGRIHFAKLCYFAVGCGAFTELLLHLLVTR